MNIIDLHCDTLWKIGAKEGYSFYENNGHITENGLVNGGYMAQCFAIYTSIRLKGEEAFNYFEERYNAAQKLFAECVNISIAKSRDDIIENFDDNKVSAVLTVENAEFLNGKIERLDLLDKRGFKILGLMHNGGNCIGYYHAEDTNAGLKPFGNEVIDAINSTVMVADVSHLNVGGFWDVIKLSKKPVIASHSACRALKEHTRNLFDDQIKAIADSGGIIGVPFYALFLKDGEDVTKTDDIICHIEHLIKVGGEETVAIGTDFDGIGSKMFIENCSGMQVLTDAIEKKFGYNLAEKICYKNALRIF